MNYHEKSNMEYEELTHRLRQKEETITALSHTLDSLDKRLASVEERHFVSRSTSINIWLAIGTLMLALMVYIQFQKGEKVEDLRTEARHALEEAKKAQLNVSNYLTLVNHQDRDRIKLLRAFLEARGDIIRGLFEYGRGKFTQAQDKARNAANVTKELEWLTGACASLPETELAASENALSSLKHKAQKDLCSLEKELITVRLEALALEARVHWKLDNKNELSRVVAEMESADKSSLEALHWKALASMNEGIIDETLVDTLRKSVSLQARGNTDALNLAEVYCYLGRWSEMRDAVRKYGSSPHKGTILGVVNDFYKSVASYTLDLDPKPIRKFTKALAQRYFKQKESHDTTTGESPYNFDVLPMMQKRLKSSGWKLYYDDLNVEQRNEILAALGCFLDGDCKT